MRGQYRPRPANMRWREGAPSYVMDVWDNGGRTADRYTVFFGEEFIERWPDNPMYAGTSPGNTWIQYLGMSGAPTHPLGISMWNSCTAADRAGFVRLRPDGNKRIRWLDLPEHIRQHVISRATAED